MARGTALRRRCPLPALALAPAAPTLSFRLQSPNRRSRSAHPLKSPAEQRCRSSWRPPSNARAMRREWRNRMETARVVLATNRRHAGWPRLDSRLSPPVPSNKLVRMAATADFRTSPMAAMPQRADQPGVFRGGRSAAAWRHKQSCTRAIRLPSVLSDKPARTVSNVPERAKHALIAQ